MARRDPHQPSAVAAQWRLSCVHAQTCFSCKKLRNPLRKALRKDVDLWKTVDELRERPHELVAYILWGDPQVGAEKVSSCHERHGANHHDG